MYHEADLGRTTKNAHARTAFWIHFTAYVLVNALLVGINLATFKGNYWFQWPLAGWGLGLAAHAVAVYIVPSFFDSKAIEQDLRKHAPGQ